MRKRHISWNTFPGSYKAEHANIIHLSIEHDPVHISLCQVPKVMWNPPTAGCLTGISHSRHWILSTEHKRFPALHLHQGVNIQDGALEVNPASEEYNDECVHLENADYMLWPNKESERMSADIRGIITYDHEIEKQKRDRIKMQVLSMLGKMYCAAREDVLRW